MIDETVLVEIVPEGLAGERLDRFVAMVVDCSRAEATGLLEAGRVAVDGRGVTAGKQRLRVDQEVRVDVPPAATDALPEPDGDIRLDVVYEDDDLVVIDKQVGLVVHPGAGNPDGTLVNGALARWPEMAAVGDPHRPGVVHRLDKGTSGLLVMARNQPTYDHLVDALRHREVTRQYVALCWGRVENERGLIDAAIGRSGRDRTRMAVTNSGKEARTHYVVVARREELPEVTLVTCRLETGRTHQIRVHLAAIGHPVVGDAAYGGQRHSLPFDRPALHAERLVFEHPRLAEPVECHAPRPPDLAGLIRSVLPGV